MLDSILTPRAIQYSPQLINLKRHTRTARQPLIYERCGPSGTPSPSSRRRGYRGVGFAAMHSVTAVALV